MTLGRTFSPVPPRIKGFACWVNRGRTHARAMAFKMGVVAYQPVIKTYSRAALSRLLGVHDAKIFMRASCTHSGLGKECLIGFGGE